MSLASRIADLEVRLDMGARLMKQYAEKVDGIEQDIKNICARVDRVEANRVATMPAETVNAIQDAIVQLSVRVEQVAALFVKLEGILSEVGAR